MSNNLDHLFKRALQRRSCEPPPYIWENIESELSGRRRKIAVGWLRGVAAVALIGAVVWFLQLKKEEVEELQWVKVSPPDIKIEDIWNKISENVAQNQPQNDVTPGLIQSSYVSYETKKNTQPEELLFAGIQLVAVPESVLRAAPSDVMLKTQGLRKEIIPITSGQALKNNLEYHVLLNEETPRDKRGKKLKMVLSGHVAPVYTSGNYSSSAINTRGYSYSKDQMNGMMNVSGGLKLSVATGKRLSVQAGIFYSRLGQHTDERNPRAQTAAFASVDSPDYDYVFTPLGNLNSHTKAVSYRSPEAVVLSNNTSRKEGIEQVFNTLEIPLSVRYRFFDNKIGLSVAGGFSGNIIVNNKVYGMYGDKKEYMGSTEDIRLFNFSTDLGLGIEYPLSRHIKIMLEPGFKYYLQSLSQNDQIDYKPYMFSLATGIGIEF